MQIFEDFLKSFQSEEPQIHRLYDEMCEIIRTMCLRFVKKDEVQGRNGKDLIHIDVSRSHQLPDDQITIGEPTRKELKKLDCDGQKSACLVCVLSLVPQ